jgi:hypothetical protein
MQAAGALGAGDQEAAVRYLRASLEAWRDTDSRMYEAAAQRRLGQLLGGDEGRSLVQAAEAAMHAQGIADIEKMTELNCPGCGS